MDENLNNKLIKLEVYTGEIVFFDYAYNARRYLLDDNLLDMLELGDDQKYNYNDIIRLLHKAVSKLVTYYVKEYTVLIPSFEIGKIENIERLYDEIAKNIYKYQNYYIVKNLKERIICQEIINFFANDMIPYPQNEDLDLIFLNFFLISCKYGIYINDLVNQPLIESVIDIYNNGSKNDPPVYIFPPHFLHPRFSDFVDIEGLNIFNNKKTFSKRVMKFLSGSKKNTDVRSGINMIKTLYECEYHSNSARSRLYGLWLWDKINNPILHNNLGVSEAYRKLKEKFPNLAVQYKNDRKLKHIYSVTKKCIDEGKILPLT